MKKVTNLFGSFVRNHYLCTVFKINTAPKILKKRELGKFINLKSHNDGKCREGLQWSW